MARPVQKQQKFGYALFVNRTGAVGLKHWERAGFLFQSSLEASRWREQHMPDVKKYRIESVRLNVEKLVVPTRSDEKEGAIS